jgi:hypothetical protein
MTFQPESFCIEPAFRLDSSLRRFCMPRVVVDEIDDLDWLVIFWLVIFEMPARHVRLPGPSGRCDWKRISNSSAGAGLTSRFRRRASEPPQNGCPANADTSCPRNYGTSDCRGRSPFTEEGRLSGIWRPHAFLERIALNLATSGSCLHASEIPSARPCCPRRSALVRTFRSAPEFPRTWREGHGRPLDVESRSRT